MKTIVQTDFSNLEKMPVVFWIILAVVMFTQGFWLFMDAGKRNANKWLWGILGLIQAPTPLLLYLLIVRKIFSRNNKEQRIRRLLVTLWIVLTVIIVIVGIIFHD